MHGALSDHRRNAGGRRLELDVLGDIWSVIHFNPEISDSALQLWSSFPNLIRRKFQATPVLL
jgi:hypothetical protein